jgi:rubrerythrin
MPGRRTFGSRRRRHNASLRSRTRQQSVFPEEKGIIMNPKAQEDPAELINVLKTWQSIETASVEGTTRIIDKTRNPLIKLVMEIIRHDSEMHYKVQQVLLDSLERQAFSLTPEELGEVWSMVETHAEMEKKTIALAEKALENCRLLAQRQLLSYLIEDEKKHDRLLGHFEEFKRGLYPYA